MQLYLPCLALTVYHVNLKKKLNTFIWVHLFGSLAYGHISFLHTKTVWQSILRKANLSILYTKKGINEDNVKSWNHNGNR